MFVVLWTVLRRPLAVLLLAVMVAVVYYWTVTMNWIAPVTRPTRMAALQILAIPRVRCALRLALHAVQAPFTSQSTVSVHYAGPNRDQEFRLVSPGSPLSVAAWIIASSVFGFYLNNFASYGAMFGSIGTMIALMLYLYISAGVLLFGAEVNAAIEHHDAARKRPQAERR